MLEVESNWSGDYTVIRVTATLALATALCAPAYSATFTDFYAFGDSLSDDGKIPLPLPYSDNPDTPGSRFSTGPTWAEIIAQRFTDRGLNTENLALGGATAVDNNIRSNGIETADDPEFPDILQPLASFSRQIAAFTPLAVSPLVQDNPLVSVFLGGNDFLQGGDPVEAANAVIQGITDINSLSAKFDDFVVSNLPELGDTAAAGGATFAQTFNSVLGSGLSALSASGLNITELDQAAFQADLFPRLADLGIDATLGPCLVPDDGFDCTITGVDANGDPIRDLTLADQRFLLDDVHPTGPVQEEFANFAIAALGASLPTPVPLPAGLPLALGGLAMFGFVRRRR